jgi:hypothetical protein
MMDQMKNNCVKTDFIVKKAVARNFSGSCFFICRFYSAETARNRIMPQWVKKNSTSVLEVLLG